MPRNNLHSFTLTSEASKIIRRESKHRYGSRFASRAIIWYDRVGIRIPEYQDKLLKELVEDQEKLLNRFRSAQFTIHELRTEMEILDAKIHELKKSQSFISKMRKKWGK